MVAIKNAQIQALLSNPPSRYDAYLIYGPDRGLVRERADQLIASLDKKYQHNSELIRLVDEDLSVNPDRLLLELKMISMFGERKILRLIAGPKLNPTHIKQLLLETPFEADLIIEAGDVKKSSSLCKTFEAAKNAATIACYVDNVRGIKALVGDVLQQFGLTIEGEAERLLISRLGGDRALSRQEIERLALYALGQKTITIEHVDKVTGNVSNLQLDHIITSTLLGQIHHSLTQLDRLVATGTAPSAVFTMLLRHMHQLHKAASDLMHGQTMQQVVTGQRPPLYFERRDNFIKQLEIWPADKLAYGIQKIQQVLTEARARANPALEKCALEQLLIGLSQQAKRM